MIPQSTDIREIQRCWQDLEAKIQPLLTGNLDLSGRRVSGAGNSIDKFDYVTRFELERTIAELKALTAESAQRNTLLSTVKSVRVGAFATRGSAVAHAQELFSASDMTGVSWVSNGSAWIYSGGVYAGADLTVRPSTLGTNDTGFRFVDLSLITEYTWSGSAWFSSGGYIQSITNGATSTVTTIAVLQHLLTTAASAAAGLGVELLVQMPDGGAAAGASEDVGAFRFLWTDATAGSEDSDMLVLLRDGGAAKAEIIRITGTGHIKLNKALGMIQFEGSSATEPALRRSGANLQTLLADGSALTGHEVLDDAYDETDWNGNIEVPTKNAVRDKIESLLSAWTGFTPTYSSDIGDAAATFTATPTTTLARYKVIGKTAHVIMSFQATLLAVTPAVIYASIPISPANAFITLGTALVQDTATLAGFVRADADALAFFRSGAGTWPASSGIDCRCSFTFEVA